MKRIIESKGVSGKNKFSARVIVETKERLTRAEFDVIINSIRNDIFDVARKPHGYGFYFNCHEIEVQ